MYEGHLVSAIIPAAGIGLRFSSEVQKPYFEIAGKPLVWYVLNKFNSETVIDEIILMVNESVIEAASKIVSEYLFQKVVSIEIGGETRTETIRKGINLLSKKSELVIIHDAVRPLVSKELINDCIRTAFVEGAAVCAVRPKNTVKIGDRFGYVDRTLLRERLYDVQTPQAFKSNLLRNCYNACLGNENNFTDDASVIEQCGYKVKIIEGDYKNVKVTTPEDAEAVGVLLGKENN